jgi:diguanylate cyclase (GGDEF)-like protein
MSASPPELRGAGRAFWLVLAAGYAAGLLLLARLPAAAPALPLAAAAVLAWRRRRATGPSRMVLLAFPPLHVAVAASGHLASPLLPLLAGWAAAAAVLLPGSAAAVALGLAAAALAGFAWLNGAAAGFLELALTMGTGAAAGLLIGRHRDRERRHRGVLERLGRDVDAGVDSPLAEAARRQTELRRALDRMRHDHDAVRVILWEIDDERERATPRAVSGAGTPPALVLRGDPLGWALDEGLPIRLERPPRWALASGATWAVPVAAGGPAAGLLTLEFAPGAPDPGRGPLEAASAGLAELARAHARELDATAARDRLRHLLDLMERLSVETDLDDFAEQFARGAADLARATGAAVALWDGESGRILARIGEDGGPGPGLPFEVGEGEMALAARAGAPRTRRAGAWPRDTLPLAAPAERWSVRPRHLVVLPLGRRGRPDGLLAVWSSAARPLDDDGVAGLGALAPFLGGQLRHAASFGSMREKAELDGLTGLPNRRAFDERFADEAARSGRYDRPLSLVLLDIDHFKHINDTHGHGFGDDVLRAVGEVVRSAVRGTDFAARFGGEEFVLLLPETDLAAAREAAERLRTRLAALALVAPDGQPLPITSSFGVSAVPACVAGSADLLRSADLMLYAAKQAGRNCVCAAPLSHVLG